MYKPRKSKAKISVMKTIVVCKLNTAIIPENNSKKKQELISDFHCGRAKT